MAVKRRFAEHRRWMWRSFLLLCSAVVIRVIGGLAVVAGSDADWIYQLASWTSWLVPLTILEVARLNFRGRRQVVQSSPAARSRT